MSNSLIRLRLFFFSLFPLASYAVRARGCSPLRWPVSRVKSIREQQSRILYLLLIIREYILPDTVHHPTHFYPVRLSRFVLPSLAFR